MSLVVIGLSVALAVGILVFAKRRAGYSHRRQTISELGERGSPDGRIVSLGLFLPTGLVLAVVWFVERDPSPAAAMLAGAISIGYCGAALFPCDPGSPLQGSASQSVHNLAGGAEYLGGLVALWRLAESSGPLYHALGAIVAMATIVLSVPALFAWRGLAQRAGECALFCGLVLALGGPAAG